MNYFLDPIVNNYANFNGRTGRKEFWMFILLNIIVSFVVGFVAGMFGLKIISTFYMLAVFIPGLAISVRRLHDTNHSGWLFLLNFIPIIGWLILFYFYILDSDSSDNLYGPNPNITATPTTTV